MLDTQGTRPDTRARILEVAESAVLAKGFAATSIEEIIAAVGIAKSGFFYHFRDKGALAKGLMLRYLEHDKQVLADMAATLVEGGLMLGRVLKDVTVLPRQILLYRDFVRTLFLPG